MTKLTKSTVERAEPKEKPYFLFDEHLPGFCARIAPNGKRHYYLQYMKNKKVKRLMLGMHGILTAEAARDKANALLVGIKGGADPLEEKIQKTLEPTVTDLSERYMKEHVTAHCKQSTAAGYRRYLDKHILPALGDMKASGVTRKDIAAFRP